MYIWQNKSNKTAQGALHVIIRSSPFALEKGYVSQICLFLSDSTIPLTQRYKFPW